MKLLQGVKNLQTYFNNYCTHKNIRNVKSFKEIPTLPKIPFIGHSYLFLPGGKYKAERLTEAVEDISKKLGAIFKLNLGGSDIVITTDADHTETLFRNEGKYPIRPPFPALIHYRNKTYESVGVVPGNGTEWYKYRQGVTSLLKKNIVQSYSSRHEEVASNFVTYIAHNRNDNFILEDIFSHLLKYTIEAISVVCPGHQFKCLSNNSKDVEDIIQASIDFMDGLYATFKGLPIWKYYKNSGYRKLETSHSTIHRILWDHLKDMNDLNFTKHEVENHNSYMHTLVSNDRFSWNDKLMLAMEVFLGGIDATATTIAISLHYLAHNKEIQELARRDSIAEGTQMSYLKACVKESLRLCPTGGANGRFTVADTTIGGYLIPKNTLVLAFSSVSSIREEYFKQADTYNPDRWLRSSRSNFHHFASLPFGFGARMCPGRRIAEQEIVLLLKQILKSYKLELPEGEPEKIGMVYRMNRIPDRKMNIKFININY